jgi:hypothetical protein
MTRCDTTSWDLTGQPFVEAEGTRSPRLAASRPYFGLSPRGASYDWRGSP